MEDDLYLNEEKRIISNGLVPINVKAKDFDFLMRIYEQASNQVYEQLKMVKESIYKAYGVEIINNITRRIKTQIV